MASLKLGNGFSIIPEGHYTFNITGISDTTDAFGRVIEVKYRADNGMLHTKKYNIVDQDGNVNDMALGEFSTMARNALNNFDIEELPETEELLGLKFEADVEHSTSPSKKDPNKTNTYANLRNLSPVQTVVTDETDADELLKKLMG